MAVFRGSRHEGDTPASGIALSPRAEAMGADRSLARLAMTTPDGDRIYLAPASGGLCFMSSTGRESACVAAERRALNGPQDAIICSPFLPSDEVEVYGTLVDGARNVRVRLDDGSTSPVEVSNNVFVIRAPRRDPLPRAVEWDASDGHHAADTGVPADAADSRCA